MSDFLSSIKADLLDRHRLPYVIALCVALVGALAYAELGGGGSSSAPVASSSPPSEAAGTAGGIALSPAPTVADAASETANGASQSNGPGRNFFKPLPQPGQATASSSSTTASSTAKAASSGSSSSSSSSSGSSSGSSSSPSSGSGSSSGSTSQGKGGSTPSQPSTPSKPKEPEKTYNVTILFGVASPPPAVSQLTPYDNLKRGLQLPSAQVPLVTFSGWTTGGASATFTLSGEAILHGPATCVPSPAQCTAIQLKPGEAEQLEYVPVTGPTVNYELQVVSITPSGTTGGSGDAHAHSARAHAAGRERSRHYAHRS